MASEPVKSVDVHCFRRPDGIIEVAKDGVVLLAGVYTIPAHLRGRHASGWYRIQSNKSSHWTAFGAPHRLVLRLARSSKSTSEFLKELSFTETGSRGEEPLFPAVTSKTKTIN